MNLSFDRGTPLVQPDADVESAQIVRPPNLAKIAGKKDVLPS